MNEKCGIVIIEVGETHEVVPHISGVLEETKSIDIQSRRHWSLGLLRFLRVGTTEKALILPQDFFFRFLRMKAHMKGVAPGGLGNEQLLSSNTLSSDSQQRKTTVNTRHSFETT